MSSSSSPMLMRVSKHPFQGALRYRQRCGVHFMRNALAHAGKSGRRVVSAFIATACSGRTGGRKHPVAQCRRPDQTEGAKTCQSHGQCRAGRARLHDLSQAALGQTSFDKPDPNDSMARSSAAQVGGIFPNDEAIVRLVSALLLEQNDEWAVQRSRYLTLETIATMSDDPLISLPAAS